MSQNAAPDAFELQLALVNAYGEVGDVEKCNAHLKEMLARNPQIGALVTWGYNALLKGYRWAFSTHNSSFMQPEWFSTMPHSFYRACKPICRTWLATLVFLVECASDQLTQSKLTQSRVLVPEALLIFMCMCCIHMYWRCLLMTSASLCCCMLAAAAWCLPESDRFVMLNAGKPQMWTRYLTLRSRCWRR